MAVPQAIRERFCPCSSAHPDPELRQLWCTPRDDVPTKTPKLCFQLAGLPFAPALLGSDPNSEAPGADSEVGMLCPSAKCNYKFCKCDSKLNQQPAGRGSGD